VLAEADLAWELGRPYPVRLQALGAKLSARVGALQLEAVDEARFALLDGAAGLLLAEGCLSTDEIEISPVSA
jgi:hypothetical protein